jgi:hypothetical protein
VRADVDDSKKTDTSEYDGVGPKHLLGEQGPGNQLGPALESSELLRRLHQVLSFFERFPTADGPFPTSEGAVASPQGSELQALTKTIELHLAPGRMDGSVGMLNKKWRVDVEPLVPFRDLRLHILGTARLNDPSFVDYCRRYVHPRLWPLQR